MEFKIRPIHPKDAEDINIIRRSRGVLENILSVPSETVSRSESFVSGTDLNSHQLVAYITDDTGREKVIGSAGISVGATPRIRHTAGFGIMVHPDYHSMGVGKKLMEDILDIADNWLMLVRVELTVLTSNAKAIALYEKMGFVIEGTRRKGSIQNGKHVDEFLMARVK